MKVRLCLGLSCLFALALFVGPASAAPRAFGVSPVKLEFKMLPGLTETQPVLVQNQGDGPLHIDTEINDYVIGKDNAFTFYPPGHETYSAASWIHVDQTGFDLQPGQSRTVRVTISIPQNAEVGGHYAAVLFKNAASSTTGIGFTGRIGTLALVTVGNEKDLVRAGNIKSLTASSRLFTSDMTAVNVFTDTGNVHLTVKGETVFTDYFGREVGRVQLPAITILPKTDRDMVAGLQGPWFGLMTATTVVSYGKDLSTFDTPRTAPPVRFWVVSWQAVVIFVLVLLVIIAIEEILRRRARNRRRAGAAQTAVQPPPETPPTQAPVS